MKEHFVTIVYILLCMFYRADFIAKPSIAQGVNPQQPQLSVQPQGQGGVIKQPQHGLAVQQAGANLQGQAAVIQQQPQLLQTIQGAVLQQQAASAQQFMQPPPVGQQQQYLLPTATPANAPLNPKIPAALQVIGQSTGQQLPQASAMQSAGYSVQQQQQPGVFDLLAAFDDMSSTSSSSSLGSEGSWGSQSPLGSAASFPSLKDVDAILFDV